MHYVRASCPSTLTMFWYENSIETTIIYRMNLNNHMCIAVCSVIMCGVGAADPSVRIITSPSNGPFRVGQTVQFTCEVELALAHPVTYQWRRVDGTSSQDFTKSFNRTFYNFNYRYCWYFCTVTVNGTHVGSADRLVEVHGKLISIK